MKVKKFNRVKQSILSNNTIKNEDVNTSRVVDIPEKCFEII